MMIIQRLTLPKGERLKSRKAIDRLFSGGSRSVTSHPVRAVFYAEQMADSPKRKQSSVDNVHEIDHLKVMFSVPKKFFKHAVNRNHVKRQLREAYRHNREPLELYLIEHPLTRLTIAFIWGSNAKLSSNDVNEKVRTLLLRIAEHYNQKLSATNQTISTQHTQS